MHRRQIGGMNLNTHARWRQGVLTPVVYPTTPVAAPALTGAPALLYSWDFADNSKITQSGGFIDSIAGSDGTLLTIGNTLTNRPSLSNDASGRQCASFTAALTQYLFANGLALAGGHTFVVVYENNAAGANALLIEICQAAASPVNQRESIVLLPGTSTLSRKVGSGGMSNALLGAVTAGLHLVTGSMGAGTSISYGSLDGATIINGSSVGAPSAMETLMVGARMSLSAVDIPFTGLIKRILVYVGALSATNYDETAAWATTNFGTANNP